MTSAVVNSHQAEQQNSRGGAQRTIEPDARLGGL